MKTAIMMEQKLNSSPIKRPTILNALMVGKRLMSQGCLPHRNSLGAQNKPKAAQLATINCPYITLNSHHSTLIGAPVLCQAAQYPELF